MLPSSSRAMIDILVYLFEREIQFDIGIRFSFNFDQ